jgi:hypothetical protein
MSVKFYTQSNCDRCNGELKARTTSWFTEETICMECSRKEYEIKQTLRAKGIEDAMEGCGYIPKI